VTVAVEVLRLIEDFEGYLTQLNDGTDRVKPYWCPAHVATVGVGSTRYPDGSRVKITDPPISKARAYECLNWELRSNEAASYRLSPRKMHEWMRGVTISFMYNCGEGAYQGSTLRKVINEGRWSEVPYQLNKWRMGGGRILAGLVRRRRDEGKLFMRGVERMQAGDFGEPEPVPAVEAPTIPNPNTEPKFNIPTSTWGRLWEWLWK
jgi:lysozyme